MRKDFIGLKAKNVKAIIEYFLKEGGIYTGTFEDDTTGFTYYMAGPYVCALLDAEFRIQFPKANIVCLDDVQRSLPVSLEEARKWYFESGTIMKNLALRVYSEDELMPSVQNMIDGSPVSAVKSRATYALEVVANYLNPGWKKSLGESGFFIAKGTKGDRILNLPTIGIGMHESVVYPGIVYFKHRADVHLAAKMLGKKCIEALFD